VIARVDVLPDDLPRIVDAECESRASQGIDESRVSGGARVEQKTIRRGIGIIKSDDLVEGVNASWRRTLRRLRIIYSGP
jgi:hypothetical protein